MALPLKSGADLYNQQLIRAAIWNNSADVLDPKEYATGLMYFNTNPSSNMYQKLRFRTGTDWKTIAFAEDLDVATNKDFLALKEKVELLSGEVDTDAIISNMKEVTAFLEGFAEDANLMSVLDGKLDKRGGVIAGTLMNPLTIKTSAAEVGIPMSVNNSEKMWVGWNSSYGAYIYSSASSKYLGIKDDGAPHYNGHTLLHKGNYATEIGDYYLKRSGGILSDSWSGGTEIRRTDNVNGYAKLTFSQADGTILGAFGFGGVDIPRFISSEGSYNTLIHSGNVGDYAVKTKGNSTIVDGSLSLQGGYIKFLLSDGSLLGGFNISGNTGNPVFLTRDGDWKTIAFTDSTVSAARKLVTDNGGSLVHFTSNVLFVGDTIYPNYQTHILGYDVVLRSGASATPGLILNSSGNVLIGTTNDSGEKLQVNGGIVANGTIACKGVAAEGSAPVGTVDKWAGSIATGTKSQTYTHALGTTDITVAIYEKNGNEWVQILTDVDIVNANTIRVTFGANTKVEHRIVVMG